MQAFKDMPSDMFMSAAEAGSAVDGASATQQLTGADHAVVQVG